MDRKDFIAPEIDWKGEIPQPPEGYREVIEGSRDAALIFEKTGVHPTHVDTCKYVLWVREGAPEFGEGGRILEIARRWIREIGRELATAIAGKKFQYGKDKIVREIEDLTGLPFPYRKLRARDVDAFLGAVRWVLENE